MEPELASAVGIIGVITTFAAMLLAYLSERSWLGVAMLGGFTGVACGLCYAGVRFGGWVGLLASILVVTFLAYRVGRSFGRERGAVFVPGLWLGFCGSCAIGYWAGREWGLVTITLPSLIIFWGCMFGISRCLLPLRDGSQWGMAFRSLVTFSLGTNHPYHAMEDRELVQRVPGNPYGQFFAGPGIVLTDPAHAPIIWDGLKFKKIGQPGLAFTGRFETVYQTVDLRPQLRSFHIEAITKDGIRVRVLTFIPFMLNVGGQVPKPGGSFPLDEESIYKATWQQPVEKGRQRLWDEVVPITAERLLRKIIGRYRFDQLCEPFDPGQDPRQKIRKELVDRLTKELQEYGIHVIGGGLSNLLPIDDSVIDKRVEAWRAEWQRKIMISLGEARANAIWELERAHIQAQADLISAIRHIVERRPGINPEMLTNMAALRFIEALEEMSCIPQVQTQLSDQTGETFEYLKRALGTSNP